MGVMTRRARRHRGAPALARAVAPPVRHRACGGPEHLNRFTRATVPGEGNLDIADFDDRDDAEDNLRG